MEDRVMNERTCFTQATSLSSGSAGALAARQVNQTQLTHIHLVFVLQFKITASVSLNTSRSPFD